jgi:hypothetical protein
MKDDAPNHHLPPGRREERREHARRIAAARLNLSAFISRGQTVRLINVSKRGALVESDVRLCPGNTVSLRFVTSEKELSLAGCIIRSSVSQMSGSKLVYRTALSFSEDIPLTETPVEEQALPAIAIPVRAKSGPKEEAPRELIASVHQSARKLTALFAGR